MNLVYNYTNQKISSIGSHLSAGAFKICEAISGVSNSVSQIAEGSWSKAALSATVSCGLIEGGLRLIGLRDFVEPLITSGLNAGGILTTLEGLGDLVQSAKERTTGKLLKGIAKVVVGSTILAGSVMIGPQAASATIKALALGTVCLNGAWSVKSYLTKSYDPEAVNPEQAEKSNISSHDLVLAASNAIQWGLLAAAGYGIAPGVTASIGFFAGLASELATYAMLPQDASLFRQAISFPVLSKSLINYHPVIGRIWQGFSLYNLARNSGGKIGEAWKTFHQDPVKALKAGALHLFNLSSGAAFAAESMGLINLKPQPSKRITFVTVFDNKGNPVRESLSTLTSENHREYAEHWGHPHKVVSKSLVRNACRNPITKSSVDCSPYWNKIKYFKDWCESPSEPGPEEWGVYADDDAVYTNFQIDPNQAIDQLRGKKDSSFIIATEGEGTRYNPGAVNTGVIIMRKDMRGCGVIQKIWDNRNFVTDITKTNCPTYGICKDQSNGDEQGAVDKVFWSDSHQSLDLDVTRVLARDETHPVRGKIAFNTFNRHGCFRAKLRDGTLGGPYNILDHDLRVNHFGIWRKGDWIVQTAGYPSEGQDLSHQPWDQCAEDPSIPVGPIRIRKVQELLEAAKESRYTVYEYEEALPEPSVKFKAPTANRKKLEQTLPPKRNITIGAVYDNDGDPNRDAISEFTNQNHAQYAHKWNLSHAVVSQSLVADKCHNQLKKTSMDCAPYWNKIQMLREWLREPKNPDVDEEWRFYFDDDMLVMNKEIDPHAAIDQLRGTDDTSVIIAEDVIDWQRWHFEESVPHTAVNTGAMLVRKDAQSREFFEALWAIRHTPVFRPTADCPNIGTCKLQSKTLHEQEAFTKLLRRHPDLIGSIVSVVPPRGKTIAMNTFYRAGCFVRKLTGWSNQAFSYEQMDQTENPSGAFQPNDWLSQVAGVPVWGKELPLQDGNCKDDPSVKEGPVRLNKLKKLAKEAI